MMDPQRIKAAHNTIAYKLGPNLHGYCDDGTPGVGRTILKTLMDSEKDNLIFFVTQYHDAKTGFERYDKVREMTTNFLKSIK